MFLVDKSIDNNVIKVLISSSANKVNAEKEILSFSSVKGFALSICYHNPHPRFQIPLDKSSLSWYSNNKDDCCGIVIDYNTSTLARQVFCGIFLVIPQI